MYKTILLVLGLFFTLSCISNKALETGLYRQAYKYPELSLTTGWYTIQDTVTSISYRYISYDLDEDKRTDVTLKYIVVAQGEESIALLRYPLDFIWIDKRGKVYAYQRDSNCNGEIDSVSGNIKRLLKTFKRLGYD